MSDNSNAPYPSTYWVLPETLLAGAYPGGHDAESTDERLRALLDAGIRSVICLMEEEETLVHESGELYLPYEDRMEELAEERGELVEILRFQVVLGSTPTTQEMEMILDSLDAEIDGRSSPTLVHCADGHGRSGTVIGCYLARHDIALGKAALGKIKELRAGDPVLAAHRAPANIVGEKFVLRWKVGQ